LSAGPDEVLLQHTDGCPAAAALTAQGGGGCRPKLHDSQVRQLGRQRGGRQQLRQRGKLLGRDGACHRVKGCYVI
jgi:hypothetical protein